MKELFCDDPTYLYATLVVIEIILVCIWFMRKDLLASLLLLVPLAAGVGVWGIDKMVVTDREMIIEATELMAAQAPKGNVKPLFETLDPSYFGFGDQRESVMRLAEHGIKSRNINSCKLINMDVIVDGKTAEQEVTTVLKWGDNGHSMSCLRWKLYWVKRPDGWKIKNADEPKQVVPGFGG